MSLPFRREFSHHPKLPFVHGGIIAALVDIAGHAAVAVWQGHPVPTINLQIDYLAPAQGDEVVARGMLRKLGRNISRSDVEVTVGDKLVALGRGTFSCAMPTERTSGKSVS